MTKKLMTLGGLVLIATTAAVAMAETRLEQLERAVRQDQATIENGGYEGKPLAANARREEAKKRLAGDQAALDSYKTAGPADYERKLLVRAVEADQAEIVAARSESKNLSRIAREDAAKKKLAQDQATLDAFKTAGPTDFERARLEKAVADDRAEITFARYESKLLTQVARTSAAKAKLAEDESALSALK